MDARALTVLTPRVPAISHALMTAVVAMPRPWACSATRKPSSVDSGWSMSLMLTRPSTSPFRFDDDEEQGCAPSVLPYASGEAVIEMLEEVVPTVTDLRSEEGTVGPFEPFQGPGMVRGEEF